MAVTATAELLRQVRLFQPMTDEELRALSAVLRPLRLPAGDTVFRQGDPGKTMIVLADGILRVEITDDQGHKAAVGTIRPGEIVGEMAVIDPAPRSATVISATDCTVYELSREGLQRLQVSAPSVSSAIVGAVISDITRRLRDVNKRIDGELDPKAKKGAQQGRAADKVTLEETDSSSLFSRIWSKVAGTGS